METSKQMNAAVLKGCCVRMNLSTSSRGSLEVEERSRGNICSFVEPAAVEPGRGKRRAQLQTEASASQIAPASVSCPPQTSRTQNKRKKNLISPPNAPSPTLIIHDVTSTSLFLFFFSRFFSLPLAPPHPSLFPKH